MFNVRGDAGKVICHSNNLSLEQCRALEHKHEFASLNLSWQQHSLERKQTDSKGSGAMSSSRRCQFSGGI